MQSRQILNPSMQVLDHSPQQLVILDGARLYSYGGTPSAKSLVIQPLIFFGVASAFVFFASSVLWPALILGAIAAALPFAGILIVRGFGGGRYATYTFDQQAGTLTCSTPAIFPGRPSKTIRYPLSRILSVEPVTKDNDDPPPASWLSIEVRMADETLCLYPGHDQQVQSAMTYLIRNFLGLVA
ncbi:MAG: hypothetical protein WBA43_21190 [Elainellaceae cyanobacterium]